MSPRHWNTNYTARLTRRPVLIIWSCWRGAFLPSTSFSHFISVQLLPAFTLLSLGYISNSDWWSSYTDMGAIKAHGSSKEYKQLQKTIQAEDLVTAPTKVVFLKPLSGFESRLWAIQCTSLRELMPHDVTTALYCVGESTSHLGAVEISVYTPD